MDNVPGCTSSIRGHQLCGAEMLLCFGSDTKWDIGGTNIHLGHIQNPHIEIQVEISARMYVTSIVHTERRFNGNVPSIFVIAT